MYGFGAKKILLEDFASAALTNYGVVVRSEIRYDVKNIKISCVGRGLMGYLGNKDLWFSLRIFLPHSLREDDSVAHRVQYRSCFCTKQHSTSSVAHLTSCQKEGDELRRNSDVMEIPRKKRFPSSSWEH